MLGLTGYVGIDGVYWDFRGSLVISRDLLGQDPGLPQGEVPIHIARWSFSAPFLLFLLLLLLRACPHMLSPVLFRGGVPTDALEV